MRFILLLGAAIFSIASPSLAATAPATTRPNIIIILADDMGFSDVGCFGGEIHTPNIDQLAEQGVRLTSFYNMARCCPTRASLQTGLYPHQTGVGQMNQDLGDPHYQGHLNQKCATIAELLRQGGYDTAMVGKWHLSNLIVSGGNPNSKKILNFEMPSPISPPGGRATWPFNRGYSQMWGTIAGVESYYNPWSFVHNQRPMRLPPGTYYTDFICDKSVELIRQFAEGQQVAWASRPSDISEQSSAGTPKPLPNGRPFFLFVAPTSPHWPLQAHEEDIKKYEAIYAKGWDELRQQRYQRLIKLGIIKPQWHLAPRESDKPKINPPIPWQEVKDKKWEARRMATYAAMVETLDRGIGRILHRIDESKISDNTLVLFFSDNGGCAENVQRDWYDVPTKTRDGRAIHIGNRDKSVLAGPEDTFLSYGPLWANLSNTPFRSFKHYTFEGGISAPFIARWPGHITRAGQLDGQLADVIDILPTCLDAAGIKDPATFDGHPILPTEGISLLPVLLGHKDIPRKPLFWEHEGNRAVRIGQWKLVAYNKRPWKLYNMADDRTEQHDLSASQADRVKEMSNLWDQWAKRVGVRPWPFR